MSREILPITARAAFRAWLTESQATIAECFVICQRGDPVKCEGLAYLDAVEEDLLKALRLLGFSRDLSILVHDPSETY